MLALCVYAVLLIIQFIKKDKTKGKKQLKFLGISFAVMMVSVVGYGISTDSFDLETTTTEKVDSEKKDVAAEVKKAEETPEEINETKEVMVEVEEKKTETSAPVEEKVVEVSTEQQNVIEAFKSNDFMQFVEAFYSIEGPERGDLFRTTVEGARVTWSGIITDLETIKDSIIMIGKTDAYNGEDWITLNNEYKELVPYVIIVEMNDPSVKESLKKGDTITLTGEIGARGDEKMFYNWKLYKGEIAN